jgi:hypothetical protein
MVPALGFWSGLAPSTAWEPAKDITPDRASGIHPVSETVGRTVSPGPVLAAGRQVRERKEPLPMIESEHESLTPLKGRACPVRTREILDTLVKGGADRPAGHPQGKTT